MTSTPLMSGACPRRTGERPRHPRAESLTFVWAIPGEAALRIAAGRLPR
ncbi:hypothetical protein [Microbacterium gorillae]|nr:hypothetical protein [Microbacterium gorillae]